MKELLEYLMEKFQESAVVKAGDTPPLSALDDLDAELESVDERWAARTGIKRFLEFSRQYLVEHPPQTHVIGMVGFGVQLAGGDEVSLVPNTVEEMAGTMDADISYPVTVGRSIRGKHGITGDGSSFGVTGKPATTLKAPKP